MFADLLWLFVILETAMVETNPCNCADIHPQENYCKSEYVIEVVIGQRIYIDYARYFLVNITNKLKGDFSKFNYAEVGNVTITLRMPKTCVDPNMKTGDKYFVFGSQIGGVLHTDLCRNNIPVRLASRQVIFWLERIYRHNCGCATKIFTKHTACDWLFVYMEQSYNNTINGIQCKLMKVKTEYPICKKLHRVYVHYPRPYYMDQYKRDH